MKTFLIVDDSAIIRKSISKALVAAAMPIEKLYEAADGRAALDLLQSGIRVDLIFLDVNMPVMNGIEFLRNLRHSAFLRHLPVVIVSTEGSDQRCSELQELGIQGQLRKPVRPEALVSLMQTVLGGKQL